MPEERDIEKQLRDHARQRRTKVGEPFQMDGVTRNLLQREVARRAGQNTPENKSWSWMVFFRWPGFALSMSVLIVLALLVPVLVKKEGSFELANEIAKTPMGGRISGESKSRALDDVSSVRMEKHDDLLAANKDALKQNERDKSAAIAGALPADAPLEATNVVQTFAVAAPSPAAIALKTESQPAGSSVWFARTDTANFALQKSADREVGKEKAESSGGKFAGITPPAKEQAKLDLSGKDLLASFQFIQSGNEIKIVDADGSVYSGRLIAAEDNRQRSQLDFDADGIDKKLGAPKNAAAVGIGGIAAQQTNLFQVSGTNLTLNALVTFTAGFFDDVRRSISETETKTAARKPAGAVEVNAPAAQSIAARISGTVRVGERESLVEARRVSP